MPTQLKEFSSPLQPPSPTRWWPRRFTRLPLAVEITLALIVKAIILTMLWKFFFAHPQAKKMRLPLPQVEQHLLVQHLQATLQTPSAPPGSSAPPLSSPASQPVFSLILAAPDARAPLSHTNDKGPVP